MIPSGIRISELIAILQKLQLYNGDVECFISGGDYPEGVRGASYKNKREDPYIKDNTVVIY